MIFRSGSVLMRASASEARMRRVRRGATLVEYCLLLVLVVVICIGAVQSMAAKTNVSFAKANNALSAVGN